jgi:S-formylglutathione hydrolase FrmB
MAFLQVSYFSKALKQSTTFNALVPLDRLDIPGGGEPTDRPMKALYLLHGYSGSFNDWVLSSNIQEFSIKHNIAIFMPSGSNFFYLNDEDMGIMYADFVGSELVEFTRRMFPLTGKREDNFIGGYSMGGYGAIRNGLKYSHNFGKIIALSSALITNEIAGIPTDYNNGIADYKYYARVFGDVDQLLGSDKDPEALVVKMKNEGSKIPDIYIACGTEDFLINENRKFHSILSTEGIKHTYVEGPGEHNWLFWNEYIEKAILWAIEEN